MRVHGTFQRRQVDIDTASGFDKAVALFTVGNVEDVVPAELADTESGRACAHVQARLDSASVLTPGSSVSTFWERLKAMFKKIADQIAPRFDGGDLF
jgi:hypothetical protein